MNNTLKANRFNLENQIIRMVYGDNQNTVHFDYHVNIDDEINSIRLDLYTRNAHNGEIFLLHQTSGTSSTEVLNKMLQHIKDHNRQAGSKHSYTVKWKNLNDVNAEEQISYFYEYSEDDVKRKFFYNKRQEDFEISITLNPVA